MSKHQATTPSEATRSAEEAESRSPHQAGRRSNQAEDEAAPDGVGDQTRKHYREMTEKGANVKGEGELP